MLQDIVVYLIVAAAAVYLARMLWQAANGEKGCGSCGGCAKSAPSTRQSPDAGGLIQIDLNGLSTPRHAIGQGKGGQGNIERQSHAP
jgi:FeoB-associated Cys-rich membrane protein